MRVIGWRCYFGDGAVCEGRTFLDWRLLAEERDDGLLARVRYFDEPRPDGKPQRAIDTGTDWYGFTPDLIPVANDDPPKENARRYPGIVLIRGKWTTDEHMDEIKRAAFDAVDPPCC